VVGYEKIMNLSTKIAFLFSLLLCFPLLFTGSIQAGAVSESDVLTVFDFACTRSSLFPKSDLQTIVKEEMKKHSSPMSQYANYRAFPYDLNGDGKPEYFVPLECGSGDNCWWGIYGANGARILGKIAGRYIYIHKQVGEWSAMTTFSNNGCTEGTIRTVVYRGDHYIQNEGYEEQIDCVGEGSKFLKKMGIPVCKFKD
jgi:hypothetical protein